MFPFLASVFLAGEPCFRGQMGDISYGVGAGVIVPTTFQGFHGAVPLSGTQTAQLPAAGGVAIKQGVPWVPSYSTVHPRGKRLL